MKPIANKHRNYGLDLARAVAISLALFIHLYDSFIKIDVGELWYTGYFGMDIFFVLSGFLIGGILIKLFDENKGLITPYQTWIFLLRRWLRTVPLYYVILIANFLAAKYIFHIVSTLDWRYFFWLQNLDHLPPAFFGESWSLCVEEWFYFSFAVGVCIFSIIVRKWEIKPVYKILLFCFGYITAFNLIRMQYATYDASEYNIVLFRLDATGYGVFAAILYRYCHVYIKQKIKLIGVCGAVITLMAIFLFLLRLKIGNLYIYYYPFIGIGLSMLIIFLKEWSSYTRQLPFLTGMGFTSRISYSYYLSNLLVIYLILHFFVFNSITKDLAGVFTAMVVIFILSLFTYNFIEIPFLRLRDKYVVWRRGKQ